MLLFDSLLVDKAVIYCPHGIAGAAMADCYLHWCRINRLATSDEVEFVGDFSKRFLHLCWDSFHEETTMDKVCY